MVRKRTRLDIYASILKRVAVDPLTFTRIMVFENLSAGLAKELLEFLLSSGALQVIHEGGRQRYCATDLGLQFYEKYMSALRALGINTLTVSSILS